VIKKAPGVILRMIKDNTLTVPNDLKIIENLPTELTSINDDETIVLKPTIVEYKGIQMLIIYMEIDGGIGLQAIDAYVL
jgi:hypothetical protein